MDHFCYLCHVFVMLSHLFIAGFWSPAGKGFTTWLLFVMFYCVFVTFPCGILGQVWYLIVSIPNLCSLSYFSNLNILPLATPEGQGGKLKLLTLSCLFTGLSKHGL